MKHELWDTEVGTLLAGCSDCADVAVLMRALCTYHKRDQMDELAMAIDDDDGDAVNAMSGTELAVWADRILVSAEGIGARWH